MTKKKGAAKGCPVSAFVAYLYMEVFEDHAETTFVSDENRKPRVWKRYVDDTFFIPYRSSVGELLQQIR